MKKLFSLVFTLLIMQASSAQFNFAQIQNQHTHNLASSQLPSLLGNDTRSGEIQLFSPYIGFANNFISAYDLGQLSGSGNLSNASIDEVLGKMPARANVWAGADIPLLNVFFNINKKNKDRFLSFGLGIREKADFNFTLNKDLLALIYKGNKQFAGQTVNLAPSLNFLFYSEYFFAAAGHIQFAVPALKLKLLTLKPAIRLRYLTGLASIYMSKANIDMYTDPEGRFIDLNTRLEAHMSSPVDTPDVESTLGDINFGSLKGPGKGYGIDLGIGLSLLENLQAHMALIDIGSIHFTRNTINYTRNATYTFEGIDMDQGAEAVNTADLENLIQPEKSYRSYRQPLPTRFVLSGFYGAGKKAKRHVTYYRHNISFTYLQGFRNYLSATTTPALNIGYAYNFLNIVNTGVGFTLGGLNKIQGGAQLGLRLGAVKMGFASNNLLPLITSRAGRGTDFSMYLGFYF